MLDDEIRIISSIRSIFPLKTLQHHLPFYF